MELSLYGGVSPDRIPKAIMNKFSFHLDGYNNLDNRLSVRISTHQVRFFFYDHDYDIYDPNAIKDNTYLKEVGFISLTRRKDTGNDILAFPQNINNLNDSNYLNNDVKDCNERFKGLIKGFPFAEKLKEGQSLEEGCHKEDDLRIFLRFCLLCFVYEFENRDMAFGGSPIYDTVRNKLRESYIYEMLSAKLHYQMYFYKNEFLSHNQIKYSYYTQKFADCLMSEQINKIIPPHDYPSKKRGLQCWFYNPEKELESILEQNRKQKNSSESTKTILNESLALKIRDFLYTKHAIYQAMTRTVGKQLFLCGQLFMALTTIALFCSFLRISWYDGVIKKVFPICISLLCLGLFFIFAANDWKKGEKNTNKDKYKFSFLRLWIVIPIILSSASLLHILPVKWLFLCIIGFILCSIFFSGYYNNAEKGGIDGIIYAFFPRILVAELAAWLTIGIAEDLVKSMLWVDKWLIVLIATFFVLILIGLIVGGEIKQHSPYLAYRNIIFKRTLPIINHSLFFGLIIGLLTQMVFYNNLIKNSDVMSSVVFNNYFDDANYYCQNLIDLDNTIRQYEDFSHTSSLKGISMTGKGIGTQTTHLNDSVFIKLSMSFDQEIESNFTPDDSTSHNNLVKNIDEIVKEIRQLDLSMGIKSSFLYEGSLCLLNDSIDSVDMESNYMKENLKKLSTLPIYLQKEITCIRRNINKYNDYDTLMNWATADYRPTINTGSAYLDKLTEDIQNKHKCSRTINTRFVELRFFPILLIFHTLIVLVLAFVTQLIISDKSVTETL